MNEPKAWVVRPFPDGVDRYSAFLSENYVGLGWPAVPNFDLTKPVNRDDVKKLLVSSYGSMSAQSLGQWAGVLFRFYSEMNPGDLVLVPYWGEVSFGRVTSGYSHVATDSAACHRREVSWLSKSIVRTTLPEEFFTALKGRQALYTAYLEPKTVTNVLAGKYGEDQNDENASVLSRLVKSFVTGIENRTQEGVNQRTLEKQLIPAILEAGIKVVPLGTRSTAGEGDVDLILPVLPDLDIYIQVKYWQDVGQTELDQAKHQIRQAITEHRANENARFLPVVLVAGNLNEKLLSTGWHDSDRDETGLPKEPVLVLTLSEMDAWVSNWMSSLNVTEMAKWGIKLQ